MKYFLHLGYKGSRYRGWQQQAKVISVQEVLEGRLSKMLKTPIKCHPCGRTDAGVHASQFFAHLKIEQTIDFDFVFRINKILPKDIVVFDLIEVPLRANAQLDATSRTYDYFIHFQKNPFISDLSTYYPLTEFNFQEMQNATSLLQGFEDFRAICLRPDTHNHTRCQIHHAQLWLDEKKEHLRFQITANRFLQGMIRIIVGRLLDIGKGKISIEDFRKALESGVPIPYNTLADPQGLYLSKVAYPFLDIPAQSLFGNVFYEKNWTP